MINNTGVEGMDIAKGILPPELKSIEQLFTGAYRYHVPRYQRSFAWGKDEIEELWEDILSAVKRQSEYFLGTIVLQKIGISDYDIIDGQQRLSCLTMVLSAIRNVFMAARDPRDAKIQENFLGSTGYARDDPILPKLILNKINNELFVQHVISSNNFEGVKSALKIKPLDKSNKLLLEAYLFFLEKVTTEAAKLGTQSDDFIVPLIDCLRSSSKLIAITVHSGEDANLFFESLNARGKELAVSDLVKNRLFTEAGDQIQRAESLWEKMENELLRKPIPDYLRHYWIAKRSDEKNLIVREKSLYRFISDEVRDEDTRLRQNAALNLLGDLTVSALDYVKISDYNLWPDESHYDKSFEESINELKLFRVTQCNPLLLNVIQMFKTSREVSKVFRIVANFSFRYFIIGNQSPGNLERATNNIAYHIRSGTITNSRDVADAFRAINPDPAFRNDFSLATIPPSRAKIARYILGKLNNHLSKKAGPAGGEQIVNPDAKQVNLEHVLPQNFSASPQWASYFSKGIDPEEYINRLGNLTLLNRKMNIDIGNASFNAKQTEALTISGLPINRFFQSVNQWGEKEIEQRQTELSKTAIEIWSL